MLRSVSRATVRQCPSPRPCPAAVPPPIRSARASTTALGRRMATGSTIRMWSTAHRRSSAPPLPSNARRPSSQRTARPTCRSTVRSTPIGAANTAASIASPGRTHAYHNLSPGLDFESKLFAKPDAPRLLRAELSKRGYVCKPIALGTNTDPYQPIEAEWRITRAILEVLAEFRHPVTITTKSNRVTRDIDLLAPMAAQGLAAVAVSVTSLDPGTARTLEPRAPAPHRRLAAIRQLAAAGIPTWISISPVIPAITDHEVEAIVEAGAEAGACGAFSLPVRLPHEVAPLFRDWLDRPPPRPRRPRHVAHHDDARRARQRPGFLHAVPGPGSLRRTDANAFCQGGGGSMGWTGGGSNCGRIYSGCRVRRGAYSASASELASVQPSSGTMVTMPMITSRGRLSKFSVAVLPLWTTIWRPTQSPPSDVNSSS